MNMIMNFQMTTGCGGISIANGGLEFPEGTNYSATAIIKCSDGYHITGTSSVTCQADGYWETPGTCEKNGTSF